MGNCVDPDLTPQNAASDQGLYYLIHLGISIKQAYHKNQTRHPCLDKDMSEVMVEESTRHKWVN